MKTEFEMNHEKLMRCDPVAREDLPKEVRDRYSVGWGWSFYKSEPWIQAWMKSAYYGSYSIGENGERVFVMTNPIEGIIAHREMS